jgi:DNA-binding transcriptional MerR regulator
MFAIGTLSKRTGVNIETIRYYERTGLADATTSTPSRRRLLHDNAVRHPALIRPARELGFEVPLQKILRDGSWPTRCSSDAHCPAAGC